MTAWQRRSAQRSGSLSQLCRQLGPPCLPPTHSEHAGALVAALTQCPAHAPSPAVSFLVRVFFRLAQGMVGDAITSRLTAGRCQLALCRCPSGHTAPCGRWPSSWPRPWNGVEGWGPTGAKSVPRSPSSGSWHSLGVGAKRGGAMNPSQPRTAMAGGHLYEVPEWQSLSPMLEIG